MHDGTGSMSISHTTIINNKYNAHHQLDYNLCALQGSVLIWDQTMFHGSAPNTSSSCRMAQFMKAFPRSKSFPVNSSYCENGAEVEASNVEGEDACVTAAPTRLVRRAMALKREMQAAGSMDSVSPLGHTLFGFDVLEP